MDFLISEMQEKLKVALAEKARIAKLLSHLKDEEEKGYYKVMADNCETRIKVLRSRLETTRDILSIAEQPRQTMEGRCMCGCGCNHPYSLIDTSKCIYCTDGCCP